jgi:hypothetical protein
LNLPPTITKAEAIAHNKSGERLDGLDLDSGGVNFIGKVRRALGLVGFDYADGFTFAEWPVVCKKMLTLRDRLRRKNNF